MAKKTSKNKDTFKSTGDKEKDFNGLLEFLGAVTGDGVVGDVNIACGSGSLSLNKALGIGGYPEGRVIEVYGPESSGKTTLTLHAIAEAQREGKRALFIDMEHALDTEYAARLGVDISQLMLVQPDSGEEALNTAQSAIETGIIEVIVIDSVAALVPRAEIDGDIGDSHVGLQARMMSQALRKMTSVISNSKATVFFINQLRMKIGVMFGNPETTTGGNALKFYASVRIDIRKTGSIKKGEELIGQEIKAKIVKNKIAPPFKIAEFSIMYGTGIDHHAEVLNMALESGVIRASGAWYKYNDENIGQGKEKTLQYLKDSPDVFDEVKSKIILSIGEEESTKIGLIADG